VSDVWSHRIRVVSWLPVLVLAALGLVRDALGSSELVGTGSRDHLWFVIDEDRDDDRVELMHHAREASGPYARSMKSLPARPIAMAAWEDRLWLVFGSKGREMLDVASVRIVRHALQERYHLVPHDRFELAPALPGTGEMVGFVGTARGPVALIVPPRATRKQRDAATQPASMPSRLLHLRNQTWEDVALPEDFRGTHRASIVATGKDGTRLVLIDPAARPADGAVRYERAEDGTWSSGPAPTLDGERRWPRRLVRVGEHAVALVPGAGPDVWDLAYLRREQQVRIAAFTQGTAEWNVFGLHDGPRIMTFTNRDGASLRKVDPSTGTVTDAVALEPPPFDTRTMLRGPVLFVIVLFALAMIVWLRPGSAKPLELPAGMNLLPPSVRLWALLIDMIPGGIVAVLVTGCRPVELLGVPLVAIDPMPYMVMAGITAGLSTGTEMMTGTSIGKRLLGARVIGVAGRPGAGRLLLRNGIKLIELMVPPLAIVVVMTPNLQGLHDLAARTVVVHPEPAPPEGDPQR